MYTKVGLLEVIPWSFKPAGSQQKAPFTLYLDGWLLNRSIIELINQSIYQPILLIRSTDGKSSLRIDDKRTYKILGDTRYGRVTIQFEYYENGRNSV